MLIILCLSYNHHINTCCVPTFYFITGRYGDALNPWGDILAAARAWCVTKPGGFFVLDLPGGGTDAIKFNANRIYGPLRWPLVTTNWKLHPLDSGVFTEGGPHVTHFFVKIDY